MENLMPDTNDEPESKGTPITRQERPATKRTVYCHGCCTKQAKFWNGVVDSITWGHEFYQAGWCSNKCQLWIASWRLTDGRLCWGRWIPETKLESISNE